MYDIRHIYTIQWVGPFTSCAKLKEHCKEGRKRDGKYSGRDSITNRLNKSHEHFRNFHENKNLKIWIGSFANNKHQKDSIIDFVETIFISRYKIRLNDNERKKAKPFEEAIRESFVIVNLWYKTTEESYSGRSLVPFEDVITYQYEVDKNKKNS